MKKLFSFCIVLTTISLSICTCSYAQLKYPAARKEAFDTVIYGRKLTDDYFWMSRKYNEKEVTEFSRQQGKLAQNI